MIDINNDPHAQKRGDLITRAQEPAEERIAPGKALYLTADARVVEADDPDAEMVFVGEQGTLPKKLADELGIKPAPKKKSADATPAEEEPAKAPTGMTIQKDATPTSVSSSNAAPASKS